MWGYGLGFLRLRSIVPIRTVLGTMAVLVGSVVALAVVRNFAGVVIGTWYIFASIFTDFFWSALHLQRFRNALVSWHVML